VFKGVVKRLGTVRDADTLDGFTDCDSQTRVLGFKFPDEIVAFERTLLAKGQDVAGSWCGQSGGSNESQEGGKDTDELHSGYCGGFARR